MVRALLSTATGKERPQLIAARHRKQMSQAEVAAKLQVNKSTVHRWEKEGDLPQPLHLRQLCDLYGVSARGLGFTAQELGVLGFEDASLDVQTLREGKRKRTAC
jgi:transcriptional regulator with XRE-family HTH domain